jgi:putative DNA primase/helicase
MTTDTRPVDRILSKLPDARRAGAGWEARCPAHDDRRASLSITEGDDARALVKCHAGCDTGAVLIALGMTWADLFVAKVRRIDGLRPQLVETYDYINEDRELVAQKVRYFPKDFRLRRPDGEGGWTWNLKGVREVPLYNLLEVRMARAEQLPVWIAEGEKDCEALAGQGEIATTNIGGAGKWPTGAAVEVSGVDVVVVADRDDTGRAHALDVARSVAPHAATLRVVESDRAKDAYDHFVQGGGFDDFVDVEWWPEPETPAPPAPESKLGPNLVKASAVAPTRVRWLWPGWLPFRKLCLLDGDPGVGKSVLALDLVARVSYGGAMPGRPDGERREPGNVLMLMAEDGFDDTTVPRLMAAGADRERIFWLPEVGDVDDEGRPILRPPEIPADVELIAQHVRALSVQLLVVDVVMAFFGRGVNSYVDADVRRALLPLQRLADDSGCVVLMLRHLTKGSAGGQAIYRGGGSIGLAGAARSVLMAGRDPRKPDATNAFVIAPAKENLSVRSAGMAYELRPDPMYDVPRVAWQGATDVTAEDIATWKPPRASEEGAVDSAKTWLREYLSEGAVERSEVLRDGRAEGHSQSALDRASKQLGVSKPRVGTAKKHRTTWSLPDV